MWLTLTCTVVVITLIYCQLFVTSVMSHLLGRPYSPILPVMFLYFFRQVLSEVPRPITVKLCHIIAKWVRFINKVQKFKGPSPKKLYPWKISVDFYQCVSIASYASAGIARGGMSVCPSVTLQYCIKTKKASVMISSPSESANILVSGNVQLIPKFDRGHPERGRFMRLGWVRTGDFGDFSTNKPPYLRNGTR